MKHLTPALPLLAVMLGACTSTSDETELANPAAEFCIEQGGQHEIRKTAEGDQGLCRLADGTLVDAWDFFRKNTS